VVIGQLLTKERLKEEQMQPQQGMTPEMKEKFDKWVEAAKRKTRQMDLSLADRELLSGAIDRAFESRSVTNADLGVDLGLLKRRVDKEAMEMRAELRKELGYDGATGNGSPGEGEKKKGGKRK